MLKMGIQNKTIEVLFQIDRYFLQKGKFVKKTD